MTLRKDNYVMLGDVTFPITRRRYNGEDWTEQVNLKGKRAKILRVFKDRTVEVRQLNRAHYNIPQDLRVEAHRVRKIPLVKVFLVDERQSIYKGREHARWNIASVKTYFVKENPKTYELMEGHIYIFNPFTRRSEMLTKIPKSQLYRTPEEAYYGFIEKFSKKVERDKKVLEESQEVLDEAVRKLKRRLRWSQL